MAQLAKANDHRVVAIASRRHSTQTAADVSSIRPALADLADVVIDNGAPWGDAALPLPDRGAT